MKQKIKTGLLHTALTVFLMMILALAFSSCQKDTTMYYEEEEEEEYFEEIPDPLEGYEVITAEEFEEIKRERYLNDITSYKFKYLSSYYDYDYNKQDELGNRVLNARYSFYGVRELVEIEERFPKWNLIEAAATLGYGYLISVDITKSDERTTHYLDGTGNNIMKEEISGEKPTGRYYYFSQSSSNKTSEGILVAHYKDTELKIAVKE